MILEQRHPQSQKSCKKAEIFAFVMVGLPHQGKSCEREMPARLDVLLLISQVS